MTIFLNRLCTYCLHLHCAKRIRQLCARITDRLIILFVNQHRVIKPVMLLNQNHMHYHHSNLMSNPSDCDVPWTQA